MTRTVQSTMLSDPWIVDGVENPRKKAFYVSMTTNDRSRRLSESEENQGYKPILQPVAKLKYMEHSSAYST